MNLRQKIKHAKKEIKILNKQTPSCTWDVYTTFTKRTKFQNIINHKRNFNGYSNDESVLKGKKLTYMELSCGLDKLCVVKNDNGKPLSKKQQMRFLSDAADAILKHPDVIYEQYKDNEKLPDDFHVRYCLYHSVDRTKSKHLVCRLYIYQFKGSKKLYVIKDGKYVPLIP